MKINELETQLRQASEAYYSGADAIMSDAEFDRLKDKLEELCPESDFLKEVGAPPDSALSKVEHTIPMGSLNKLTTLKEYETWLKTASKTASDLQMAVSWKLDGLSCELVFEKGKFARAITRGDGNSFL
jgi:DNA ligase (NAD+)